MKKKLFFATCMVIASMLGGCRDRWDTDPFAGQSAERIAHQAEQAMQRQDYAHAVPYWEALIAHYPFGPYARAAQIQLLYAQYQSKAWEDAHLVADRFIKMYPQDPHLDYVYYIKARTTEVQADSFLQRVFSLDPSRREPQHLKAAFELYKTVVTRFPHSAYATRARQHMQNVRHILAAYELHVAQYYLKRGAEVAAFNRARSLVISFSETPARDPALQIMEDLYHRWHKPEWAQDVHAIRLMNPVVAP